MNLIESMEIGCPYCGQGTILEIDTSLGNHGLTVDCEVCCRPMDVEVECEPGELFRAWAVGE